jgi:outer membrane protein OmpA-like peptidoglycan-associated protein
MNFLKKNVATIVMGILFLASTFGLVISMAAVSDMESHVTQLSVKVKQLEEGLVAVSQERDLLRGEVTSLNGVIASLKKKQDIVPALPTTPPVIIDAPKPAPAAPTFTAAKPEKMEVILNFDFNSYKVKPEGAAEIRKVAEYIKAKRNKVNVSIKGYADSTGDANYNVRLSKERADQVYFRLVNLAGGPMKKCELEVVGLGAVKVNGDTAGKRAVKIIVTDCK